MGWFTSYRRPRNVRNRADANHNIDQHQEQQHHHIHQRRNHQHNRRNHIQKARDPFAQNKNSNNNENNIHIHHHNRDDDNGNDNDDNKDDDDDEYDNDNDKEGNNAENESEKSETGIHLSAIHLNNTRKAEVDMVFFNRVPKVGSQALMHLMERLGHRNGFKHTRDSGKKHETILMKPAYQKELIVDLLGRPKPNIYTQHVAYINFTRFYLPKPIYINLVRDPIERIISWHYYFRAKWYYQDMRDKLGADNAPAEPPQSVMEMDLDTCVRTKDMYCQFNQMELNTNAGDHRRQTLFFCGQNYQFCMPFNSAAAMQKAKRTVEADYAVVGTWEDKNITLTVLEHYIPLFFKGAKQVYFRNEEVLSKINRNNVTRIVSDETRDILRKNLTNEIEFYEFCKQRLYLQYAAITGGDKIDDDDYLLIPEQHDDEYNDNIDGTYSDGDQYKEGHRKKHKKDEN